MGWIGFVGGRRHVEVEIERTSHTVTVTWVAGTTPPPTWAYVIVNGTATRGENLDSGVAGDTGGNQCVQQSYTGDCVIAQTSTPGQESVEGSAKLPMESQSQGVIFKTIVVEPSGVTGPAINVKVCNSTAASCSP